MFVEKQEKADMLFKDLLRRSYPCLSLHGGTIQIYFERGVVCACDAKESDQSDLLRVLYFVLYGVDSLISLLCFQVWTNLIVIAL